MPDGVGHHVPAPTHDRVLRGPGHRPAIAKLRVTKLRLPGTIYRGGVQFDQVEGAAREQLVAKVVAVDVRERLAQPEHARVVGETVGAVFRQISEAVRLPQPWRDVLPVTALRSAHLRERSVERPFRARRIVLRMLDQAGQCGAPPRGRLAAGHDGVGFRDILLLDRILDSLPGDPVITGRLHRRFPKRLQQFPARHADFGSLGARRHVVVVVPVKNAAELHVRFGGRAA